MMFEIPIIEDPTMDKDEFQLRTENMVLSFNLKTQQMLRSKPIEEIRAFFNHMELFVESKRTETGVEIKMGWRARKNG